MLKQMLGGMPCVLCARVSACLRAHLPACPCAHVLRLSLGDTYHTYQVHGKPTRAF